VDRHRLDIRRLINRLGLRVESMTQTGRHMKVLVSRKGETKQIIFPISPSDQRWMNNQESLIKKLFNL